MDDDDVPEPFPESPPQVIVKMNLSFPVFQCYNINLYPEFQALFKIKIKHSY
jgi:hypothetical protein